MRTIINIAYLSSAGVASFLAVSVALGLRVPAGFQVAFFALLLMWTGVSWLGEAAIRRFEDAANQETQATRDSQ